MTLTKLDKNLFGSEPKDTFQDKKLFFQIFFGGKKIEDNYIKL